ncbi:hypothetical protein CLU79DRAFT_772468 [Phycomyces nitens]|nr:hypothetical protein CLU79DRAFT_772468 [Phycomyces nitens]
MSERLPLEVLSTIADLLHTSDKKTCSIVCKRWKDVFQKSLWKIVKISKRSWIQNFEKCVKGDTIRERRHHVQSIQVYNLTNRTDHLFPILVKLFPQVKDVFYSEAHCNIRSLTIANLGEWKLLSHMYIQLEYQTKLNIPEALFKSLSVLPSLVHLTLNQKSPFNLRTAVTWRQIDQLHYHLPRLQYLKCWMNLCEIDPNDIDSLEEINPVNDIRTIDYGASHFNIMWTYYLALKYPKLETLNLTIDKEVKPSSGLPTNDTQVKIPQSLPYFFPCLRNIYTTDNGESGLELAVIYSQISKSGARLEKIETSLFTNIDNPEFPANETECIQTFSSTLKTLRIFRYSNVSNISDPFWQNLDVVEFSRLVYMRISSYSVSFEIGNVLDVCPSLISLEICYTYMITELRKITPAYKHGLQHLKVNWTSTYPECFEYISDRCRSLKHLLLNCVEIKNTNTEKIKCLHMSMQFTRLLTLSLCEVHLEKYPNLVFSTGHSCKDNYFTEHDQGYFTDIYLYYASTVEPYLCALSENSLFEWNIIHKDRSYDSSLSLGHTDKPREERSEKKDCPDTSRETFEDEECFKRNTEYCCVVFQCKSIKQIIIDKRSFYSDSSTIFNV